MIIGIGTDLCENNRIRRLLDIYGHRFLKRIYLEEELQYCMSKKDPVPHLAGRFALKEAFIKSLGLQRNLALSYADIGLLGTRPGKKDIYITGKMNELYHSSSANKIFFSIAHAENYSSAYVVLEKQ